MRAALGRRDDVDERTYDSVVARAPAQCDVDGQLTLDLSRCHVTLLVKHWHRLVEMAHALEPQDVVDRGVRGEELAELGDAAREVERLLVHGWPIDPTLVTHDDGEAWDEKRGLASPVVK